jgi:hypothetical protein
METSTSRSFSDLWRRTQTRALFVYSLANRLPAVIDSSRPLDTLLVFGRFATHIKAASSLLPRVLLEERIAGPALGIVDASMPLKLTGVTVIVAITPRADLTFLIDGVIREDCTSEQVSNLLAVTCFQRAELTLNGVPILKWVRGRLDPEGQWGRESLEFGRDVHQMIFPGGQLLGEVLAGDLADPNQLAPVVSHMIYRGTVEAVVNRGIRTPEVLNNSNQTVVAHGRGVSVIAGWGRHVENCFALTTVSLISALGVIQRARRNAFQALSLNGRVMLESTTDARTLVSRLSAKLNDMQLDLSFGVEAYIDSVLIPELVVEAFQSSLRDTMGVRDGLSNTSRMLERLHSVIQTRLSALEAAVQEQVERRNRVFSAMVAVGSIFALPPALLLAFFGINGIEVVGDRSIFDMAHYWPAYVLAWLPFVILLMVGFILARRVRVRSPQIRVYEDVSSTLAVGYVDDPPVQQTNTPDSARLRVREHEHG